MATNIFYQFDTGKQNIMSNADYGNHTQRSNGVGEGAALSALHNKLFYQVSTITSALAEVMKLNGYDMGASIEASWTNTVTQLGNIVTKAFLTANHYTKTETQNYVTGLLALYDLSTVVDTKIAAAIKGIDVEGGGVTINNVKTAIEAAFSITQETIEGVTFGAYKATYSEVDTGTESKKYVTPAAIKDSTKVPHGTPTEGNVFVGNGSAWESKAKSTLGFLSEADLSAYALLANVFTQAQLLAGSLNTLYYTQTQLNPSASAGSNILDARYFTETEADARFAAKTYVDGKMIGVGQDWRSETSLSVATKSETAGARPIMVSMTIYFPDATSATITIGGQTVATPSLANASGRMSFSFIVQPSATISVVCAGTARIQTWAVLD